MTDPVQVLRDLVEENPKMSEAQIRKKFMELARNDPALREAVVKSVFADLWKKNLS